MKEPSSHDPAAESGDGARAHQPELEALIRQQIAGAGGQLPFDRFMELALYAPGLGYYVAGAEKFGPAGDFVTAPEVSPLFARCLAAPCREVLDALGAGDILELGAGTGALAATLLEALSAHGPLPGRYLILEPSPDLAARQRELLSARCPRLLDRCTWLDRLPKCFTGLVLANEVLDAMPAHRFRIGADGTIEEIAVEYDGERFVEARMPASPTLAAAVSALQGEGLATEPGYCSEVNLRLAPWVEAIAEHMSKGMVLVIDYGYPRRERYLAERKQGTLMCYSRHRSHSDPLQQVGLQDITTHVDFTALAEAARAAGLDVAGYTTQSNFLIGCGIDGLIAEAAGNDPAAMLELSVGAKQLLLPSRMGERFQVMALSRGLPLAESLSGFAVRDLRGRL